MLARYAKAIQARRRCAVSRRALHRNMRLSPLVDLLLESA